MRFPVLESLSELHSIHSELHTTKVGVELTFLEARFEQLRDHRRHLQDHVRITEFLLETTTNPHLRRMLHFQQEALDLLVDLVTDIEEDRCVDLPTILNLPRWIDPFRPLVSSNETLLRREMKYQCQVFRLGLGNSSDILHAAQRMSAAVMDWLEEETL